MGWIAGYHDHFGTRRCGTHETWEDARAAVVDELDQRIMALHAEPGADDADELAELQAAMAYFAGEVRSGEEAAGDAACLTFVLVPDHADELADQVETFAAEVIRLSGTPRFSLGRIVATPGALATMADQGISPSSLLARHVSGDWGNVPPEDAAENELSVREGFRILSSYGEGDARLWLVTEWDRSATTILKPTEY